jgi:hypothetical protein
LRTVGWLPSPTAELPPQRHHDGGPIYTETQLYLQAAPDRPLIAEPWNGASAFAFVLIVLYWGIRLRGRYARYPFLSCCLPLLLVGGIGGTLYHALRVAYVFFLMDVWPIQILTLVTSVYLWVRLLPRWWYTVVVLVLFFLAQGVGFLVLPVHDAITLSYAVMGVMILAPTALVLAKTRFRHGGLVVLGLALFGLALFFRYADAWRPPLLPMGTHWLWHVFGAAACAVVAEFLYLLEGDKLKTPEGQSVAAPESKP